MKFIFKIIIRYIDICVLNCNLNRNEKIISNIYNKQKQIRQVI